MLRIDARGLACPQPVLKAKAAVDDGERELCVLVDGEPAASNVTRFLEKQGFTVTSQKTEGAVALSASRTGASETPPRVAESADAQTRRGKSEKKEKISKAVLLTSRTLGGESVELGEALMKMFLSTLAQDDTPPETVALMNGAVFLATADSSCSDTLKILAQRGASVLVCGTCVKHFEITDQIAVGTISNMFEITEALFDADKPLVVG